MSRSRASVLIACCAALGAAEEPVSPPPVAALAPTISEPVAGTRAEPVVLTQAGDGGILLPARAATIHGAAMHYEPQQHRNSLCFWTRLDDWASWTFTVERPGTFTVEVLQGCGKGSGGAEVTVAIGAQVLAFTVEDTGHFQNLVKRAIGELTIAAAGSVTLEVRARSRPGVAVMDLRQIELVPLKHPK